MSKPTLAEYLAAVKARCEAATKGPWEHNKGLAVFTASTPEMRASARCIARFPIVGGYENAVFTAHSRTDVEVLAGIAEVLRKAATMEFVQGGFNGRAANRALAKAEALVPAEGEEGA